MSAKKKWFRKTDSSLVSAVKIKAVLEEGRRREGSGGERREETCIVLRIMDRGLEMTWPAHSTSEDRSTYTFSTSVIFRRMFR